MVSVSRRAPCCPTSLWLEVLLLLRGLGLGLNHLLLWIRDVVFPHVLHQVRLRGVGPAADGAGIDLGMFHRVCSQVYLQRGSICVCTVAVVALERFVFVVLPSVGLQVGKLRESLFTTRVSAFVGSVPSVDTCVLLQVGELAEGLLAVAARVGLGP